MIIDAAYCPGDPRHLIGRLLFLVYTTRRPDVPYGVSRDGLANAIVDLQADTTCIRFGGVVSAAMESKPLRFATASVRLIVGFFASGARTVIEDTVVYTLAHQPALPVDPRHPVYEAPRVLSTPVANTVARPGDTIWVQLALAPTSAEFLFRVIPGRKRPVRPDAEGLDTTGALGQFYDTRDAIFYMCIRVGRVVDVGRPPLHQGQLHIRVQREVAVQYINQLEDTAWNSLFAPRARFPTRRARSRSPEPPVEDAPVVVQAVSTQPEVTEDVIAAAPAAVEVMETVVGVERLSSQPPSGSIVDTLKVPQTGVRYLPNDASIAEAYNTAVTEWGDLYKPDVPHIWLWFTSTGALSIATGTEIDSILRKRLRDHKAGERQRRLKLRRVIFDTPTEFLPSGSSAADIRAQLGTQHFQPFVLQAIGIVPSEDPDEPEGLVQKSLFPGLQRNRKEQDEAAFRAWFTSLDPETNPFQTLGFTVDDITPVPKDLKLSATSVGPERPGQVPEVAQYAPKAGDPNLYRPLVTSGVAQLQRRVRELEDQNANLLQQLREASVDVLMKMVMPPPPMAEFPPEEPLAETMPLPPPPPPQPIRRTPVATTALGDVALGEAQDAAAKRSGLLASILKGTRLKRTEPMVRESKKSPLQKQLEKAEAERRRQAGDPRELMVLRRSAVDPSGEEEDTNEWSD